MANVNLNREEMPRQEPEVRVKNYREVALGYSPTQAQAEAERCIQCKTRNCVEGCPVNVDIPDFIKAMREGDMKEAVKILKGKNALPGVCGRVCPQESQCENACILNRMGAPIAIGGLERYVADWERLNMTDEEKKPELPPTTGKKVAMVGSGPAGLTAAYQLARQGHEVTVFESMPVAGGMMRIGIPDFRLPPEVLEKEIKEIENIGVTIKTNSPVESIDDLKKQGYDAVFISVGAHKGTMMGIEGENLPGVMDGVAILRDINLGNKIEVGKRVMVIGGGNVAMDASRTAVRTGADVTVVYRRTRNEMPASDEEIDEALEEGVKIEYLTNPTGVEKSANGLKVTLVRMRLGKVDESGRRRPEPIEGSEYTLEFDSVIKALGQESVIPDKFGVETVRGGRIVVDKYTLANSVEGIYAGGDVTRGPASVIEAIADGRQAAVSMDLYLGGEGVIDEVLMVPGGELPPIDPDMIESDKYRPELKLLPVEERIKSYAKVLLGFDAKCAKDETKRCLQCDLEES